MRLEEVTAEIRPRSDDEAIDLGLALARRDFWRCLMVWWLAMLAPAMLAAVLLWDFPGWLLFLFWWFKTAGSRMVLFVLSRRLFGEIPGWRVVFREIPRAWTRRFFHRFFLLRLSPWLPVTLPVEDLEGLRGKNYKLRCGQLSRRGSGAVSTLYFLGDLGAVWVACGLVLLADSLVPEGRGTLLEAIRDAYDPAAPFAVPLVILRIAAVAGMVGISLVDLFTTAAGFGVYVNNRTWIEGWDVELAFKRLAKRLAGMAVAVFAAFVCVPSGAEARTLLAGEAGEIISEIKRAPEFEVRKIERKIPKPKPRKPRKPSKWNWKWSGFGGGRMPEWLPQAVVWSLLGLLLAGCGWLVWVNRRAFRRWLGASGEDAGGNPPAAKVVLGLDVTPESLPPDVISAACTLWMDGKQRDAMALLYRAAISWCITNYDVPIRSADTEGDCLRRVDALGAAAHARFFRELTEAWVLVEYARLPLGDEDFRRICGEWPYAERRAA